MAFMNYVTKLHTCKAIENSLNDFFFYLGDFKGALPLYRGGSKMSLDNLSRLACDVDTPSVYQSDGFKELFKVVLFADRAICSMSVNLNYASSQVVL